MRNSFFQSLEENAGADTVFITGDLGYGAINNFVKKFPKQFVNAGVAEQNMIGMAAGLALAGKKVFAYSIANFNTLRCLEQIRNDVAFHNLNVTVVSVGGGLCYGSQGISHHATEDIAIMRAIPNMKVFAPGDTVEAYEITKKIIQQDLGPVYLRLGRAGEATIHSSETMKDLIIGKGKLISGHSSANIALVSTGGMLETAMDVAGKLSREGKGSSVYSFHTVKPLDNELIISIFEKYRLIASLEEHSITGGFSSAILEALVGVPGISLDKYIPFALPPCFTSVVGDQNYLKNIYGISAQKIFIRILEKLSV